MKNHAFSDMVRIFIFFLLGVSFLYIGIGGFIYLELVQEKQKIEKTPNPNDTTLHIIYGVRVIGKEKADLIEQLSLTERIFPIIVCLPLFMNYIITAMSFGAFGSFGNVVNSTLKSSSNLHSTKYIFLPLANGAFAGVIVLAISYTVPFVLSAEAVTLKPTSVVFFCLFAGFKHFRFFDWFGSIFEKKIFKTEN